MQKVVTTQKWNYNSLVNYTNIIKTTINLQKQVNFTFQVENMSHFAYECKTEGQNGISHLISELLRTLDSLRDRLFDVTEWRFLNPLIMQTC